GAARRTRQLRPFSRKQIRAPQQLLLREVLAGMEAMLRRLIGEDVQLSIETPQDLGHVAADPGQLEQVILNLVVNARDAMPNGGRLDLSVSNASLRDGYPHSRFPIPAGDYVTLTVRDTGVGMTTEVMAHLFEPFFTTKEVGKGTGLGLATADGVVHQRGGSVR